MYYIYTESKIRISSTFSMHMDLNKTEARWRHDNSWIFHLSISIYLYYVWMYAHTPECVSFSSFLGPLHLSEFATAYSCPMQVLYTFWSHYLYHSCCQCCLLFRCASLTIVIACTRSPSVSRIRAKMLYATSKDRFRRELDGIHYEIQATDPSEMELDVLRDRAN